MPLAEKGAQEEYLFGKPITPVKQSGLPVQTVSGEALEAYYVGRPDGTAAIAKFRQQIGRATESLGEPSQATAKRIWIYGAGAIPFEKIAGEIHPAPERAYRTAPRVAKFLFGKPIPLLNQLKGHPAATWCA